MDFACPRCAKALRVDDSKAGKTVMCPKCSHPFKVPTSEPPLAEFLEEDEAGEEENVVRESVEPRKAETRRRARPKSHEDYEREELRRKLREHARAERLDRSRRSLLDFIPLSYPAQVNIGVGIGLILSVFAGVLFRTSHSPEVVVIAGVPIVLVSLVFSLWGCAAYATNKGYSEFLGVLGLFGIFGLIILACLPSRSR